MSATISPTEQTVVLRNTSWATYQRLLDERGERTNPRFTFDQGLLEIMVVSSEHERAKAAFSLLCELAAAELGVDLDNTGSTTFQREDLERGFEPDVSFYTNNAQLVRGLPRLDLNLDPPPNLVIEIDISRSSIDKLALFAAAGISEVWRYRERALSILVLEHGTYQSVETSGVFPGARRVDIVGLVIDSASTPRPVWIHRVREWAVGLRAQPS